MPKTYIAGIPHRKPDLSRLKPGDLVLLQPEPENKFDPQAIKVLHGSVHLGYIPKDDTRAFRSFPSATITEIDARHKWREVRIEAKVQTENDPAKFTGYFGPDPRDPNF